MPEAVGDSDGGSELLQPFVLLAESDQRSTEGDPRERLVLRTPLRAALRDAVVRELGGLCMIAGREGDLGANRRESDIPQPSMPSACEEWSSASARSQRSTGWT
jgi:hypothetical protein